MKIGLIKMKSSDNRYSKEFYRADDVSAAIRDYKKLAKITISEENGYYICTFSDCLIDPKRIVLEFDNYLIELMNSRGEHVKA